MGRKLNEPGDVLRDWVGKEVQVIVRGKDSDAYLARFEGTLRGQDGNSWTIGGEAREVWIGVPHTMREYELVKPDVLQMRHDDGETTVRLADDSWDHPA
jgi:hypothetical protein